MIKTQDLSFEYTPDNILRFPDVELINHKDLLILGESGSGKTTLLHLMGLLLNPTNGQIEINGTDVSHLTAKDLPRFRAKNIGMVYQKSFFIQSLNVLENLEMALYLTRNSKDSKGIYEVLEQLGLEKLRNKKVYELSGGEQQRLSIARALIHKPALILADEPTSALDDKNTEIVYNLMSDMCKAAGSTLIIVSHDQRLKSKITNQIEIK